MVDLDPPILIITSNVNNLNTPRQRLSDWFKKKNKMEDPTICYL